jgi:hypothetical protein
MMVSFRGTGCGEDELTWAQRDVWDLTRRTGRTMNIGGAVPLPPDETVDGIATLLRYLVSRHQSLRTRLRIPPDGPPRQVVYESGEVPLEIVDIPADGDPAAVVEAKRVAYQLKPFDPEHEWPVRMCVFRRDGVLTHLVVMYYHLAIDGFGLQELVDDLVNLDRATGEGRVPPQGTPALEQAREQRTPAGRRQSERSLRQWENLLRVVPARRYRKPGEPAEPPIWEINCTSPALALAVRAVAARTGLDSRPILLAAGAAALAEVTGVGTSVFQVLVSNRFRAGLGPSVSNVRQFGLVAIEVAGAGFDELVARAARSALSAYKNGYFDPVAHRELVERIGRERGEEIDISCYFNDRRTAGAEAADGPVPTGDEVRAALDRTHLRWGIREATYDGTFYLHVEDAADAVEYAIFADTRHLAPGDIEACARAFERVVVDAVPARPAVPSR